MKFPRASGILLHPTSLPGKFGIGDLGPEAFRFVDFLAKAKQTYWQILPLEPTGWGDSPYASFSAFAGNTLLISPEKLVEEGILEPAEVEDHPSSLGVNPSKVDYGAVYESKNKTLRAAFERWSGSESSEFQTFAKDNSCWLEEYALYRAIKASRDQKPWYEWDDALKRRKAGALDKARETLRDAILAEKFYQFIFFSQWAAVKEYANSAGVKIVGDVPIFVALDVTINRYAVDLTLPDLLGVPSAF